MKLVITIALFFAAIVYSMTAGFFPNYSDGTRVGTVTKLSRKGFVFKSWEGEMQMGMVRDATGIASNVFHFNASDEAVAEIKEAMRSGARVELGYRQWGIKPIFIDSDYVAVSVTLAY